MFFMDIIRVMFMVGLGLLAFGESECTDPVVPGVA